MTSPITCGAGLCARHSGLPTNTLLSMTAAVITGSTTASSAVPAPPAVHVLRLSRWDAYYCSMVSGLLPCNCTWPESAHCVIIIIMLPNQAIASTPSAPRPLCEAGGLKNNAVLLKVPLLRHCRAFHMLDGGLRMSQRMHQTSPQGTDQMATCSLPTAVCAWNSARHELPAVLP
jgi:hypothetical protein